MARHSITDSQFQGLDSKLQGTCMILDLEGFILKKHGFIAREMGYCAVSNSKKNCGSFHYSPIIPFKKLNKKSQGTVHYCIKNVHGLPYWPHDEEQSKPFSTLNSDILKLYQQYQEPHKPYVAFKGGHIERDLLTLLNNLIGTLKL